MSNNLQTNLLAVRNWYSFWREQYSDMLKQREYADAELCIILEDILGIDKVQLQLNWDKILTEKELKKLNTILSNRMSGKPLSKILGYKYFYGLKFFVNSTVLDPRPETEYLVELAIKYIGVSSKISNKEQDKECIKILDLGTGSGCIPISIINALQSQHIDSRALCADICLKALRMTEKNATANNCQNNIECVKSDWLIELNKNMHGKFNVITSNPPYLSTDEEVGEEIRFDPKKALYADEDGFAVYRKLLEKKCADSVFDNSEDSVTDTLRIEHLSIEPVSIENFLTDDGVILMEVPARFTDKILSITDRWKFRKFFDTCADNIKIFACSNRDLLDKI